jgi:hypothetical protein
VYDRRRIGNAVRRAQHRHFTIRIGYPVVGVVPTRQKTAWS